MKKYELIKDIIISPTIGGITMIYRIPKGAIISREQEHITYEYVAYGKSIFFDDEAVENNSEYFKLIEE